MKVLVVGSLPPPVTLASRGLLDAVLTRKAAGHDVEVVSASAYSVAHKRLDSSGLAGLVELALAARRADEVVLQIEPGFPLARGTGQSRRAAELTALASLLRRLPAPITLRLQSAHDMASGIGGRAASALWASADRIEVGDAETGERLSGLGPTVAAKVTVAPEPRLIGAAHDRAPVSSDGDFQSATAAVRARAATERARWLAPNAGEPGEDPTPRVALWEWVPAPGIGIPVWSDVGGSAHPAASLWRRLGVRLLRLAESRPTTRPLALLVRRVHRLAKAG